MRQIDSSLLDRAIARDYAQQGDALWNIFNVKDRKEHEWHYRGLADSLRELQGMLPVDSNVPAGIMEGWTYTAQDTTIDCGTTIFLYTDGLNEAEDPTTKAEVDTTLSAEERPIGGLGIHLVRQIMDDVAYERRDNKNVLTLRKKLNNK